VGNTRPYAAELDVQCLQDAELVVVDTWHAVEEAGELKNAVKAGALPKSKQASLAQIVTGDVSVPETGRIVFKSVGSALQDLALAARYYELLAPGARASEPQLASPRRPVHTQPG
jgi:ornithine cyclodeaminase/alanine dehydrogenase-like protein (mu-crystallin family)